MIDFTKIRSVHFIGVGGIGISAIARMFLLEGKEVSGSDRNGSEITEKLLKLGAKITIGGQTVEEIPKDAELVIYSAAIEVAEPKLLAEIKKLKILFLSYSEALGEISRGKYTIAIAGTHGKTTVTGMVATVLIDGGLSPTVVVGSVLNREKSNFIAGTSDYFIVEADEYRRSFLSLSPKILVINNIDLDHLDYFKDLADIQSSYRELAMKVPKEGFIVTNSNSPNIVPVLQGVVAKIVDYTQVLVDNLKLPLPGGHNKDNARIALSIAEILGVSRDSAVSALNNFQGTWRRFERVGEMKSGAFVYDDYAHNPQKITALIAGAREYFPRKEITIVFQPHL